MLVSIKYLLAQGFIKEDDRDEYSIYYIIPKAYSIKDVNGNTLFSIEDFKYPGEYGTTILTREDGEDPINLPNGDLFTVTIFKNISSL